MTAHLGIDPSLRHTGLCLLIEGAAPLFHEIRTPETENVLSSLCTLRAELLRFLNDLPPIFRRTPLVAMEKQLPVGGQSSALMFTVQMWVLDCLRLSNLEWGSDPTYDKKLELVMPLPIQLKAYMKKEHGVDTTNKSSIVNSFKKKLGHDGRISSHRVEAYFLARMAEDVRLGKWRYRIPSRETELFAGKTLNGHDG